jgi:Domain of Unknown Function with PDB structure (DUF3857)
LKASGFFFRSIRIVAAISFFTAQAASPRAAQDSAPKPAENAAAKPQEKSPQKSGEKPAPKLPAEIELLETRIRFETNGDSRKEVHTRVKINDELGTRQFARLNFDFNRSFEQIEIPLVRVTHPSGGTADVLPSAITDTPNPAVVNAPAYQDVRIKSVRILGLEPGDSLEYRVITMTTHHPLAPDFWFDHTFDRSGVVSKEICEIDLPAALAPTVPHWGDNMPQPQGKAVISSGYPTPEPSVQRLTEANEGRVLYRYEVEDGSKTLVGNSTKDADLPWPDVGVGFMPLLGAPSWAWISHDLYDVFAPRNPLPPQVIELAQKLIEGAETSDQKFERIYDFVSQKIKTVDLPLGATGFHLRPAADVAASRYGTPEDKVELFMALAAAAKVYASAPLLIGASKQLHAFIPTPSAFAHILVWAGTNILDPSLEVAPFRMLPASYRGSAAVNVGPMEEAHDAISLVETVIPKGLPFPSSQRVQVDAALDASGGFSAKVRYTMRGDNELLLRVAFHQAPKEKWDEVAQLLALSDGFRGKISKATASDPYETRDPFTVSYEIAQPKFLDWAKKPLRIPAILPLLGLPDPPTKPAPGASPTPIDLGTPLDVEVTATVHLPAGTTAHVPTGTSVQRDFATYTSQYSAKDATLTATRHLNFILKEIPAGRAADYNTFLRAVQNDESQVFTLERADTTAPKPQTP